MWGHEDRAWGRGRGAWPPDEGDHRSVQLGVSLNCEFCSCGPLPLEELWGASSMVLIRHPPLPQHMSVYSGVGRTHRLSGRGRT